ncbi:MAG: CHAT domain-containing protein [Acidobacteria bacterium]|nr:CHAT domain-containing protein [Acidobacteriota bacterium]
MPNRRTAELLVSATSVRERRRIVDKLNAASARDVTANLRAICYETWTSEPLKARRAAVAIDSLADSFPDDLIRANGRWVAGIAAITRGRFEVAITNLDGAAKIFRRLGNRAEAANTQVAKLIALALVGRYEDAVKVGRSALKTFIELGDDLAAGKIEMNLSNIVSRREKHRDAEKFCLSALARFRKCGAVTWETMALNDLANTYSEMNDFRHAEDFYEQALSKARSEKMLVTEAEIEASMGNLAIFRGRFDEALRLLELSRQKYDELKMPHQSAIAELEIAGVYAELNLDAEAEAIFEKNAKRLKKLQLGSEEARAAAGLGRVAFRRGNLRKASTALGRAAELYANAKDPAGAAAVLISSAELELTRDNPPKAFEIAMMAVRKLKRSENRRQQLIADWIRAEAIRGLGRQAKAQTALSGVLAKAIAGEHTNLAQACMNSLGSLAMARGDLDSAEKSFTRAAEIVESLRAPLPAEEFRMSFLADKLSAYESLAQIHLRRGELGKALGAIERAKARTLSENIVSESTGSESSELSRKRDEVREELNWFYSRLNRSDAKDVTRLEAEVRRRERQIADIERQIGATQGAARADELGRFELSGLQKALGRQTALIEFIRFGESYSAFTLTGETIDFFPDLANEAEILALLEGLQFQFGALRYGGAGIGPFVANLKQRADSYLERLYAKLIAPFADSIGRREIIVVPAGVLNYVPFNGLRGDRYLIEEHDVWTAPSASVGLRLLKTRGDSPKNALLIGFADEKIPLVNDEIEELRRAIPNAEVLLGPDATFANYRDRSGEFDALHIACHGQFRPDNPMFSSLHLADGFVTVRDICAQRLRARVVTLSACETGLNKVFAGDEILGLARGFLTAGAESLVLSLWTVNDAATARLMTAFYKSLQRGNGVAASLREAQLDFVREGVHPYFWSPFIAIGK